jgi:hypothetical protein
MTIWRFRNTKTFGLLGILEKRPKVQKSIARRASSFALRTYADFEMSKSGLRRRWENGAQGIIAP